MIILRQKSYADQDYAGRSTALGTAAIGATALVTGAVETNGREKEETRRGGKEEKKR